MLKNLLNPFLLKDQLTSLKLIDNTITPNDLGHVKQYLQPFLKAQFSKLKSIPKYQVSIVHAQMKAADKDYEMNRFIKGETQIMVATTVI